jgi:hypothetical protein
MNNQQRMAFARNATQACVVTQVTMRKEGSMVRGFVLHRASYISLALLALASFSSVHAQAPLERGRLREPVYKVPRSNPFPPQTRGLSGGIQQVQATQQEHPLVPAIRMAKNGLAVIDENIRDYSCTLVKRERIDDKVTDYEYMFTKVRHKPFSVYMYFLAPKGIKGRECIYVDGTNDGKLVAHEGGGRIRAALPTVNLDPTGLLAMRGQRYPITEVGVRNLTARLVEVAEMDSKFGECTVNEYKGAKIDGQVCTCLQVVHPVPRKNFRFHLARVFIHDELQIPIRFESYGWPSEKGGNLPLLEEYTYMNMKINQGFTDADFDRNNKDYNF